MDHLEVDGSIVVTAIIGAAVTFLGWVIRVAARTTLEGLKSSIDAHARAVDDMRLELHRFRGELSDFRVDLADAQARLKALERE